MKIAKRTSLTITLAVLSFYTSESAAPTTVTHPKVQGLEVTAGFASVDGCIGTDIVLFVAQDLTRNKETKTTTTEAILGITKLDLCNGTVVDDLVTLRQTSQG